MPRLRERRIASSSSLVLNLIVLLNAPFNLHLSGNLPFTATKEEIQAHFAKVEPIEIRLMTDKDTQKPKGFAFVEFDRFDRMETCLKKYQHSVFPDGKKGRKINVELT